MKGALLREPSTIEPTSSATWHCGPLIPRSCNDTASLVAISGLQLSADRMRAAATPAE